MTQICGTARNVLVWLGFDPFSIGRDAFQFAAKIVNDFNFANRIMNGIKPKEIDVGLLKEIYSN
jgi:hypothetical protein